ncbi:Glutathione synthetase [Geitlerinema sp. FC II]|nr:glutathione synthase [Geitlerinema sp. CS-897]PPT11030.1 Glutathione synthetase [Geitlerinema sp. FC II]
MKFAFIIDPIQNLDPGHDTTVAFMEAVQALGHEVWITQAEKLGVVEGKAYGWLSPATFKPVELKGDRWVAIELWYEVGEASWQPLEDMDAVLMRTDPPVDVPYLYTTYILDYVDPTKTLVLNDPKGLRAANEKMYALQFKDAIPETLVTRDKAVARGFVNQRGKAILKPLGGKAGEGIFMLSAGDRNLNSLMEVSTNYGRIPIMVQQFLPEAKDGDKRIILLDGEPIGAVNRIPTGEEFRGNMAVGGRVAKAEISDREREICRQLAPTLKRDGLYFVGIDVIGGYLTEVNVTSPTGIREIDRLDNVRLGETTMQWVIDRVTSLRR